MGSNKVGRCSSDGRHFRDTNHRKAARNIFDVKSDTSSMCAAFVAKHTKTRFMSTERRVCPFLSVNGPAKSMPVRWNGGLAVTRC